MTQSERVLEKYIFAKGEKTWEDVCRRVAKFLADTEEEYQEFYNVLQPKYFLPNSPCLRNAGLSNQLFACFVLPIEDSMESIFETLKNTALIHKTGGGTGFNFSKLRGKGTPVGTQGTTSSGVVSFMKVYDAATEGVKQGGVRRGANMAVLNVDHPDIEEFITCKTDQNAINNFNISVALNDKFMHAINTTPSKKQVELFDKIVNQAWLNGEPGVLFIDTINRKHKQITGIEERIEATNPCGEQPLLPYECCCLGSLNLSALYDTNIKLKDIISTAVKMLNKMLDKNEYPLPQNKEIAMKNRKIGLGVMGYADALIKQSLTYGSKEALERTAFVADSIQYYAYEEGEKYGNKTATTIAPTGTLSILAGCSSGIEPNFSWTQVIKRMDSTFTEVAPIAKGKDLNNLPDYYVTSQQVDIEGHIRTQAIWQKFTDNAVSKTINLPNSATREDVKKAILLAYELGCKGITVYRDGSRDSQVINTEVEKVETKKERATTLLGRTDKFNTGCGNLYITVNTNTNNEVVEVFSNTARGGCPSQSEAVTRLVAKALQFGVPKADIIKQLKGIRCPSCTNKNLGVSSCPDAIAKALQNEVIEVTKTEIIKTKKVCPVCKAESENTGGCFTCPDCGFGKCG